MDPDRYPTRLRPLYKNRSLILTGATLAALVPVARLFRTLGARRPFLLAAGVGTGPLPDPDEVDCHMLKLEAADIVQETRKTMALLGGLPQGALAALDRYDPERRAWVMSPPANELPTIAGRRVYGPRRPEWRRLEDKTIIDELWDACGIRRPLSAVVTAAKDALVAAAHHLDRGMGTVWAGDTREGLNGGAIYLRWVRSAEDAAEAARFLMAHCDRARVTPFIEGVPCSIHGVVFPDGVAVFRPIEMVTLRRIASNRLVYAGASTFWDPTPADREAMRRVAQTVGVALRDRVEYRGAFTVDGVMSEDGFLPTELNTRFGAGLVVMAEGSSELPLWPLNLSVVQGEALGIHPTDLEADMLEMADQTRSGAAWTVTRVPFDDIRQEPVVFTSGRCRVARDGEKPVGMLLVGPSNVGGLVKLVLDPELIPVGTTIAPLAVAAFALADERFGAGIGPLTPARPVR